MNRSLIEQYARGADSLAAAIVGLKPQDFLEVPIPKTWSIAQISLHLMDADLIASDRMKRIIAENNPTIVGYNETAFAQKLFYDKLDPFLAAELFKKNRQMTAALLRHLPDDAFARFGNHNERGKITLESLIQTYVEHLEHHLAHLRKKRALIGKPL